jgi:blue copper oxidase
MKTTVIISSLAIAISSTLTSAEDVSISLIASESTQQMVPGFQTNVFRYTANIITGPASTLTEIPNSYLGPIISVHTGDSVLVTAQNSLPSETTVHWHGLDISEDADGHPKDAFGPNESYSYEFIVRNRAGTYWYHPHPDMMTGEQVYKGLASFFIVSDNAEQALDLPRGEYDLPICIQDVDFDSSNQLVYSGANMMGMFGNTQLINGRVDTNYSAATRIYRVRLLNGSQSRILKLALDDGSPMIVIGVDGGLLEAPVQRPYLLMGPGERYELWVDFSTKNIGDVITLQSLAFDEQAGGIGQGDAKDIMTFTIDRFEQETLVLPTSLVPMEEVYNVEDVTVEKLWPIVWGSGQFLLNGQTFDMLGTIENERAPGDALEMITMTNVEGNIKFAHPMHLHGRQFQILSRSITADGVDAYNTVKDGIVDEGWQDTFMLMPNETVSFLIRWSKHPGLFMYHCHNLPHEDMGMMRNFELSAVPCPADLTRDSMVDISDFLEVIGKWGTPFGDVTGDDRTDIADILTTIADWGVCSDGLRGFPQVPLGNNRPSPSR